MDNNEIRREILEIMYEIKLKNPHAIPTRDNICKRLSIEDNLLDFNIRYLESKGYLDVTHMSGGNFIAQITSYGIDIVENNEEFNRQFPISVTQNIVNNSHGVVINSNNVSINIQDAFNEIYQQLDDENPENKDEILEKINELKQELQKEDINKLKVQNVYDWLKRHVNWIIPSIVQIGTASLFGKG